MQRIMASSLGYYCVGFVAKAHGIRGEVLIRLFARKADWLERAHVIALDPRKAKSGSVVRGELATRSMFNVRPTPDGLLVLFEGIKDRNQAESLKGQSVWIPEDLLQVEADRPFLYQFIGLKALDFASGKDLGQVEAIDSNGTQDLLVIQSPEAIRYEVPLVEPIFQSVDWDNHRIFLQLPEGLMEINRA